MEVQDWEDDKQNKPVSLYINYGSIVLKNNLLGGVLFAYFPVGHPFLKTTVSQAKPVSFFDYEKESVLSNSMVD